MRSGNLFTNQPREWLVKVEFKKGPQASVQPFQCKRFYWGQLEGRPGEKVNYSLLESLKKKKLHVVGPVLDFKDSNWPEIPEYQVKSSSFVERRSVMTRNLVLCLTWCFGPSS